jgi:hypothetical protein
MAEKNGGNTIKAQTFLPGRPFFHMKRASDRPRFQAPAPVFSAAPNPFFFQDSVNFGGFTAFFGRFYGVFRYFLAFIWRFEAF